MKLRIIDIKWEGKRHDMRLTFNSHNGSGLALWRYIKKERRHQQLWPLQRKAST